MILRHHRNLQGAEYSDLGYRLDLAVERNLVNVSTVGYECSLPISLWIFDHLGFYGADLEERIFEFSAKLRLFS